MDANANVTPKIEESEDLEWKRNDDPALSERIESVHSMEIIGAYLDMALRPLFEHRPSPTDSR